MQIRFNNAKKVGNAYKTILTKISGEQLNKIAKEWSNYNNQNRNYISHKILGNNANYFIVFMNNYNKLKLSF